MANHPYLKKSPKTGTFSYRRAVPEALRSVIGKREIKRSLKTNIEKRARAAAAVIDLEVEALFQSHAANRTPEDMTPLTAYHEAMRWVSELGYKAAASPDQWSEEEFDRRVTDASIVEDLAAAGETKTPELDLAKRDVLLGKAPPCPTFKDASKLYLFEVNESDPDRTEHEKEKVRTEMTRYSDYFLSAIGANKRLTDLTRADGKAFVSFLQAKNLKPASINTAIGRITTILNHSFRELEINRKNPLEGLKVKDSEVREKRRSFTTSEHNAFLEAVEDINSEARNIAVICAFTGARPKEISGLLLEDIRLKANVPHIRLQHNELRRLKTESSKRNIPLVAKALEAARAAVEERRGNDGAAFPRYAGDGGDDALSAVINKVIRKKLGIKDKRLVAYSLRHTVKDWAREAQIPDKIAERIFGRASSSVGDIYGDGFSLETLTDAMLRIVQHESETPKKI